MTKKNFLVILIITLIIVGSFIGTLVILNMRDNTKRPKTIDQIKEIPDETGAELTPESIEEKQEGEAINNLIKSLPYSTAEFTITEYDYKTGRFIVEGNNLLNIEEDFNAWFTNSEFRTIPIKMFNLSK